MHQPLRESKIRDIPLLFRGKVRDVYDMGGELLLIISTDRISAFDYILPTPIPGKGVVLTQMSRFWMKKFEDIIPNHLVAGDLSSITTDPAELELLKGRAEFVRKARPLPVELIVRGYLAGSGYKEYTQTGNVCGIELPAGLQQAEKLPNPIFTPSTKAPEGEHDENISFDDMIELVGLPLAEQARDICLKLYTLASEHAAGRGIIIADTKIELGLIDDRLILIDEVFTPDSSRFWPKDKYQTGMSPPSFDKQFVRDYLSSTNWDKNSPPPPLPDEIIQKTAEKYREALERLTK